MRDVRTFLVGCLLLAGCGRTAIDKPADDAAVKVDVVQPVKRSLTRIVEQPGSVQPFEETQIFVRVPGYASKVLVDIGQRVKGPRFDTAGKETRPGDLLAELAVPDLDEEARQKAAHVRQSEAEADQSRKALAAAEAQIGSAEAQVVEAKAGLLRAEALYSRWESELKRMTKLVKDGTLDVQTRDETENQFRAAQASKEESRARVTSMEAAVRKARADRDKADADVRSAQARIEVARAEQGRADAVLGFAQIRAPFDGVVTRRRLNTGDLVQPSGARGEGLFTVSRLDPVRIVVAVPEADASLASEGTEISLVIASRPGPPIQAKVTRTSWSLDPGARTLRTEVDLPNADGGLRPGAYVFAKLSGRLPEAWTVPAAAIVKQGDDHVVFLVVGGKAVRTRVQIGRTDGQFTELVRRHDANGFWIEPTGQESLAARAAGLHEGRAIRVE